MIGRRSAFKRLGLSKRGAPPQYPTAGSIGENEDGGLFHAHYQAYDGIVTWVPMQWWRWLHKRRIHRDILTGNDWYVYQLEKTT